jgi:uridine phosphorylase
MESATLFIVSQILGARAGCVLNVVWNQEREKAGMSNPKCHDTEPAIKAAVEAVRILMGE